MFPQIVRWLEEVAALRAWARRPSMCQPGVGRSRISPTSGFNA
ncbi:hypothetical protein EDD90_8705 [Streptomyces sp. Ag109_O5-1]|nr:hypothetical protein EDD90_8705 [Streptomyces sp. Ag109_O5-1]